MAYFQHLDDEFDFGKYKGLSLSDVMDINPEYIVWCMMNISNNQYCSFIITDEAMQELISIYPDFLVIQDFEDMRKKHLYNSYDYERCDDSDFCDDEQNTFECYNGFYVQDEMGYSDDDIDTIFDGNPDAYWNID
ncbi:hypothetical protein [Bacteroides sp. KFT8]|jgi:hypothetical protein|uniref:exodeoxyribonuclease X C-terminal domain-containing protein n=1 Tax=Bacteroides sp. KFT8 TaxID=2025659 RepID=UPI000C050F81|nr:hypothetical protein [Bacteroides sp. KFT8]